MWSGSSMESFRQHQIRAKAAQHGNNLKLLSIMHISEIYISGD
jgi:hypothetical protein